MNEIKLLIKHSKYFIPALTILSLCKLILFYYLFDIRIGYFISLEEILTPFISDILFYTLSFFIPYFILSIFFGEKFAQNNLDSFKAKKNQSFSKRIWQDLKDHGPFWGSTIGISIAYLQSRLPWEGILTYLLFIPLAYIIFWIRREALIKTDFKFTEINSSLYNISTLLIIGLLLVISNTFSEVYRLKYKPQKSVVLEFDSKQIICSDSIIFIGRTANYSFIYDRKSKQTSVFTNTDIKRITSQ